MCAELLSSVAKAGSVAIWMFWKHSHPSWLQVAFLATLVIILTCELLSILPSYLVSVQQVLSRSMYVAPRCMDSSAAEQLLLCCSADHHQRIFVEHFIFVAELDQAPSHHALALLTCMCLAHSRHSHLSIAFACALEGVPV